MEINSSNEETQAAVLLTGTATYILNTIANLKTELKFVYEELKKKSTEIKTLEGERDNLQHQVDEFIAERSDLKDK